MERSKVIYYIENGRLYKKFNDEQVFEVKCSVETFLDVLRVEEKFGLLD